jgi:predicted TIM-barrel fold metal-dependent hydrolase
MQEAIVDDQFEMISADSHFLEPPNMWDAWLPDEYVGRGPRLVDDGGGGAAWKYADSREPEPIGLTALPGLPPHSLSPNGVTYDDARPGTYEGRHRLDDQEIDGVSAEVIFPTSRPLAHFLNDPDPALALAGTMAYNRFVEESFCAAAPRRLFPVAQIPTTGLKDALTVLEWASARTFVGVVLASWPSGQEHLSSEDAAFWATAEALGMPVCIHVSLRSREERLLIRELALAEAGRSSQEWVLLGERKGETPLPLDYHSRLPNPGINLGRSASILSELLLSGIFDVYPTLQVGLIETWVGWIPRMLEAIDDTWIRNRHMMKIPLKYRPSEYWSRNMVASFLDDRSGVILKDQIGIENMMWSSDYPHFCTTWPSSRSLVLETLGCLAPHERELVLSGNCRRFYRMQT